MYEFQTKSGTRYTVNEGRITREGDEILNRPGAIVDHPFTFIIAPEIGKQARFLLTGERDCITTSVVVNIRTRPRLQPRMPCICGQHTNHELGVVDFYGATAQQMGIPLGYYHYSCAVEAKREAHELRLERQP
jgi:hypothetical protein